MENLMPIATYYMPKRFEETVKLLANGLGIKITQIKTEGSDIRLYCVSSHSLLDMFNELRIGLLAPEPIEDPNATT
jgi:hypothetical protein